ncbi:hypothetical protein NL108_013772 [Boleophthalmus pectinirostris]|nr:hypothetical protein NL108_013772 [Boleophthalmus pectinirostris]
MLKKSLPYSQFCRLKRICHKTDDFERNLSNMMTNFEQRGYKKSILNDAATKVKGKSRSDFLRVDPPKNANKRIVFSTGYSKPAEQLQNIITKHWHILKTDPSLGVAFKELPLVVYKRGRNLGDRLVHFYLPPNQTTHQTILTPIPDGNRRCGGAVSVTIHIAAIVLSSSHW